MLIPLARGFSPTSAIPRTLCSTSVGAASQIFGEGLGCARSDAFPMVSQKFQQQRVDMTRLGCYGMVLHLHLSRWPKAENLARDECCGATASRRASKIGAMATSGTFRCLISDLMLVR